MKELFRAIALSFVFCCLSYAQTPAAGAAARSQIVGQVKSVDAAAHQIVLQDDHGAAIAVTAAETTSVLRIPPGETDLKKATKITFGDVASGDRILAVGTLGEGGKELQARTLVIMTKSDIAQKQQRELQDWQTRGVAGPVTAVDAAAKTFTIKAGQKQLTIATAAQTEFRRYAPNSVQFSDSAASSFSDIRVGDQVRALGDKTPDGLSVKAERVVSGSFRQLAGTVNAIHAEAGEIEIKDLASKKTVTISVNSSSVLKKLSPVVAAALARRLHPNEPGQAAQPAGPRGGRGGAGGGELGQILDRLPPVALADLKPGDAIMISGSAGTDPGHLTAITLLAGVEPLLTASPDAARDVMAGWNFGDSGGGPE